MIALLPKVTTQVLVNGENTKTRYSTRDYTVCNEILLYMFERVFPLDSSLSSLLLPPEQSMSGVELFTIVVCDHFTQLIDKLSLEEMFADGQEGFVISTLDALLILSEKVHTSFRSFVIVNSE